MITIYETIQKICLELPETSEKISHGSPAFSVKGKGFAIYSLNHHGDGRVAFLLKASHETQQMLVESAPDYFFIPPYYGPSGWFGIDVNKDLSWQRVSNLTHEAYISIAPHSLVNTASPVEVQYSPKKMTPEEIDPLKNSKNATVIEKLRKLCNSFPETNETKQFGSPTFKAGKKSYCSVSCYERILKLQIWVGDDRQVTLTEFDKRFDIPDYIGRHGWINLNLAHNQDWIEISSLVTESYKHFALKRMLKAL
jgi:hypothetical protein